MSASYPHRLATEVRRARRDLYTQTISYLISAFTLGWFTYQFLRSYL